MIPPWTHYSRPIVVIPSVFAAPEVGGERPDFQGKEFEFDVIESAIPITVPMPYVMYSS